MATININRGLIGQEDIKFGSGSYSRRDSSGASQTMTELNLGAFNTRIYNVQDYIGGEPNGTADNSPEIQAAIDACEATGGVVYFPGCLNAYRAIGLTVDEPIMICGDGRMSNIKSNGNGSVFTFDEGTNQNAEGQNSGVVVRDLYLDGNSRTDSACAFTLAHLDHAIFENLWIEEFLGTNEAGLRGSAFTFADSVRESRFTDIQMRYCGTYNSKWVVDISDAGSGAQDPSNNNIFARCGFIYYYGDAVVITNPGDATNRVRGNKFDNCLWHGVLDTTPIHTPTSNDKMSRAIVITESEANIVENCRFSTLPADNPAIYVNDTNTGGPTIPPLSLEVRGCLFTAHHTSSADQKWAIKVDAGSVSIRQSTFVAQDPAWEAASGASIYRDDSNIFISPPSSGVIVEAADTGPSVMAGDGVDQGLSGDYTIQTKNAAGVLTRRISAVGGTDTKELKLLGIPFRVSTGAPSHTTDAGGAAINNLALYLRTGGADNSQTLYVTYDSGTTWEPLTPQSRTGAATPVGSVTPRHVGEVYVDTTADTAYVAVGLTSSDWDQISN